MRVTVVGAGVVGLSIARELEARGHTVQVVAAARGDTTTSAVAGAIWFPYRAGGSPRIPRWARRARERWAALSADPAVGVDLLTMYECALDAGNGETRPWWADGLDITLTRAPVAGAPPAWRFQAPRVEPAITLAWLEAGLARPVRHDVVTDLSAVPGDAVVNCAGLGARALAGDHHLEAVYGHVVIVEPGTIDTAISFTDDRPPGPIFYSIPRRTEVVLGGVSEPCGDDRPLTPDPAVRDRILAQCRALGWEPGRVLRERGGLRPFRPEVRLERDPADARIVHCYGHGGSGWTLAWGCAEDVAALVDQEPAASTR